MLTAGDVIRRCITYVGGDQNGDKNLAQARQALQDAVRDFPNQHRWNWYRTVGRLVLNKAYNTGTVAFNAGTNQLTLTGGTWPTWAASGRVKIGSVVAQVVTRVSDTVLTLDPTLTFPATIASGTGYSIFRDSYPLPDDFSALHSGFGAENWGGMRYTLPQGWLWGQSMDEAVGVPDRFSIFPRPTGGFEIRVRPWPDGDKTLDFLYYRIMRPVVYDVNLNQGTLTVSGINVTCTKPMFVPGMVGSAIRITSSASPPELKGLVVHETTIATAPTTTTLTLAEACPVAGAALGYTVSDPIDVEPNAMATAFQWLAIRTAAAESMSKGTASASAKFQDDLEMAKAADSRYAGPDRVGGRSLGHPAYWRAPVVTEE